MLILLSGCFLLLGQEETPVEPDPFCEEAVPAVVVTDNNDCVPIWVCCQGDPAEHSECWYQSGDPEHEVNPGLVWKCGGSLASCDQAEDDASYWACFVAEA